MPRFNGKEWFFDSVEEALAFERGRSAPAAQKHEPKPRGRKPRARRAGRPPRNRSLELSPASRHLLETASRLPAGGLLSDQFAALAGHSSAKAIPPLMMMLGKELRAVGMTTDEVIARDRIYVKGRSKSKFRPGPRLAEILQRKLFDGGS